MGRALAAVSLLLALPTLALVSTGVGSGGKLRAWRVPSSAMEPTLHCAKPGIGCLSKIGDIVLTRPLRSGEPRRTDILVLRTPPKALPACGVRGSFIKRVIGLPEETVREKRGYIFIDARKLSEPYLAPDRRDSYFDGTWRVPKGEYFLMGDNRSHSCDSRSFGSAPRRSLVGKVVAIQRGSRRINLP